MKQTLLIRGHQVPPDDLTSIQSLIKEHWQKGQKFISQELCRYWQWYQPNGNLKDMACRELLLRLQPKGLIQLLPGRSNPNTSRRNRSIPLPEITSTPPEGELSRFGRIELKMTRHTPLEPSKTSQEILTLKHAHTC